MRETVRVPLYNQNHDQIGDAIIIKDDPNIHLQINPTQGAFAAEAFRMIQQGLVEGLKLGPKYRMVPMKAGGHVR